MVRSDKKVMKKEESADLGLELEHGVEKNTSTLQTKHMAEQLGGGSSQDIARELSKGNQQCWENQWQEFLKTLQPTHTVMLEMAPWEDTNAFLASFEQVAKACRWPREEWAARLLPALSGEAEEAFQILETRDKENYEKVRAAILRRDAMRMELQRQHFREFCCPAVEDPRRIHSQVQELCYQWLKPERRSKEQILELLILEQFLASLPTDLQNWIRAGGPDNCSQAVALVEDFMTSQQNPRKETWPGPLKEENLGSLDAEEEPSDATEGVTYREVKQNGDVLGNVKGSHIKTENSQYEGNEPAPIPSTTPQKCQGDEMETSERYLQGWESSEKQLAKTQNEPNELTADPTVAISQTCEINNRDVIPLFSSYGRKCGSRLNPDMLHNRGGHSEWPLAEENFQQNPYTDKQQRRVTGERKSEFSENGKEGNLDRRQNNQAEEKPHSFFECGKKFSYIDSLGKNQEIQNEGSPYEHCLCRKCCSEREQLRNHQQPQTGVIRHECLECGKLFTSRQILVGHQRIHTGERRCKCTECGKCFRRGDHLKKHQRIHTGQKPYKCSQCGKNFRQSEHLKLHQRIHTGEKPYVCPECGKCFTERGGLKKHRRIHTGEKPYKCPVCEKCFIVSGALKKHQRIHTREKPYVCLKCGESFSRSGLLKNHQRIHTGRN